MRSPSHGYKHTTKKEKKEEKKHISQRSISHKIEKQNSYETIPNISARNKGDQVLFQKFSLIENFRHIFSKSTFLFLLVWKSHLHFSKKSVSVDTHYPSKPVENGNGVPRRGNKLMEARLQKNKTHPSYGPFLLSVHKEDSKDFFYLFTKSMFFF